MPELVIIEGVMKGHTFSFFDETVFIGRSSKNDVQIQDAGISRKQLKIFRIGKKFFVEDLKSTNGTSINGERIPPGEGFEVDEGDSINIGSTVIQLRKFPPRKLLEVAHLSKRNAESKAFSPPPEERRSRPTDNLDLILKVSEFLKGPWDIKELLEKILDYVLEALPRTHRGSIILFSKARDGEREIMEVISKVNVDAGEFTTPYSRTVVDRVMREGRAVRMSNTSFEDFNATKDSDDTLQIGSVLCVPLISHSEIYGAIYVDTIRKPYGFRKDDLLLLNSLSGAVALVLERAFEEGTDLAIP